MAGSPNTAVLVSIYSVCMEYGRYCLYCSLCVPWGRWMWRPWVLSPGGWEIAPLLPCFHDPWCSPSSCPIASASTTHRYLDMGLHKPSSPHLLRPDARCLLHGQEPPHAVRRVHEVILGRHGEGGQVLQQVGRHPAPCNQVQWAHCKWLRTKN